MKAGGHTGAGRGGPAAAEQVEAGRSRCLTFPPKAVSLERCSAARMCPWTTFSTKVKSTKFSPFLHVHKEWVPCVGGEPGRAPARGPRARTRLGNASPWHTWASVTVEDGQETRAPRPSGPVGYLRAHQ